MIESELRADQQDKPVQVQPDQRGDRDGKAGIDLLSARRKNYKGREYRAHGCPHEAPDNAADQRRPEVDFGVRHEHVQERKYAGDQQVGNKLSSHHEYRSKGIIVEQVLHYGIALDRGDHADRSYHRQRANQQHDQVLGKAAGETARLRYIPHVVKALFDLLHHADRGVEKKRQSNAAQYGSPYVVDQRKDLACDLLPLRAEGREHAREIRFELIENAEPL